MIDQLEVKLLQKVQEKMLFTIEWALS